MKPATCLSTDEKEHPTENKEISYTHLFSATLTFLAAQTRSDRALEEYRHSMESNFFLGESRLPCSLIRALTTNSRQKRQ